MGKGYIRLPFDFYEGESELVSGFDYSIFVFTPFLLDISPFPRVCSIFLESENVEIVICKNIPFVNWPPVKEMK